jgi:tRNA (guanine37-N1)-methyltransferase
LEYPHYTRLRFQDQEVPEVLLSGITSRSNLAKNGITQRTLQKQPDFLKGEVDGGRSENPGPTPGGNQGVSNGFCGLRSQGRTKEGLIARRLYVGLVHYPVYNKRSERIASAITSFDLHDLSRLARTYGVRRFFVIIPLRDQRNSQSVSYWTEGYGAVTMLLEGGR